MIPLAVAAGIALAPKAKASAVPRVPEQGGGYAEVRRLASQVEGEAGMPGFTAFALAVADRESDGNNLSANTSPSEAAAACRGYHDNLGDPFDRYVDNPYPESRWCFGSGGYYGLLPSTALAAKGFHNSDPWLVFDPEASTALFADWVYRIVRGYFHKLPAQHRTFLTLRRFMSSNTIGLDWREQKSKSPKIRERFATDLRQRGIDPSFMHQRVRIKHFPGAVALYQAMTASNNAAPAA